jgi:hypothetical protein
MKLHVARRLMESDRPVVTEMLWRPRHISYLFAKYDGPNKGFEVWYVGDLSGVYDPCYSHVARHGTWCVWVGVALRSELTPLGLRREIMSTDIAEQ